ncbi:MAG TPA: hypothetical protein DEF18_16345 [Muricauda sp.]|nr:hypothetical protein [uncultured Allomuricauda sp.]MAO18092.1 hypothetical protein [Allomuricauda sp.]MBC72493.1 hypothetical protein [Allomuricauda sp.]HBU79669.1 hypothetical protein [Allomuricauda sp.]|tara:strand:+ start:3953 stop:4375 length:423 start_codon:yes stop_codon:yes gene_type:complete
MEEIKGILLELDSNIVYCTITMDFIDDGWDDGMAQRFLDKIKLVSKGRFLPLLFDLRQLNYWSALRWFIVLSPPSQIGIPAHSITFLVRSHAVRSFLSTYCLISGNAFWNTLYTVRRKALENCQKRLSIGIDENNNILRA